MKRARHSATRRDAFTLVEIAVTIVIVGLGLVLVLEGLNTAKLNAAQTRNMKLAHELGLATLGQIESGLFQDEIDSGLRGTYAEEGHADIGYEVIVGDETFEKTNPRDSDTHDSWAPTRKEQEAEDDEEEDAEEPYEKVRIRVTFPKFGDLSNELIMERWMPWIQVYGETEESESGAASAEGAVK